MDRTIGRLVQSAALLAAAVALVAACAPLTAFETPRFDYREGSTYVVTAGGAATVAWTVAAADLGLSERRLQQVQATWIPAGSDSESADVAGRLITLGNTEVEPEWNLRLWQARLLRTERPAGMVYRVELEVRVDVPESAYDLTRRVSGEILARDGEPLPFTFLVRAQ